MANPNSRPAMNGTANRNIRIASNGAAGGAKVDPNDPQVRKLVYNMYRGMLGQQHQQANQIVDSAPQEKVEIDAGVGARVESMMRQQSQLKGGGMNTAGTSLPPPPPPPIPTVLPSSRLPTEIPARAPPVMNPPAALAGAMMKDKKPFTYTPGGIDLSEINSPNQNGSDQGESMAPVQSRSFRVLQNVLSNQDVADVPSNGVPMRVEVPLGSGSPSTQPRGAQTNSGNKSSPQRGSFSQASSSQRGPVSLANMGQRGSVSSAGNPISQLKSNSDQQQNCTFKVIPIQQDVKITPKMGGFKTNNSNGNELSSIFRNQVQVSTDSDEARSRGGYFPQRTVVVTQCEPQGPVHIPNLRQQQKPSPLQQPVQYQPPTHYQPTSLYQQPGGVTSSAPTEDAPPEPKKYMGGSIPSRSFKMLQALTSTDDASDNGVPANGSEASHPTDSDTQHAGSQIPSPAWKTHIQSSPSPLSPSSTPTTTNDSSSDSGIFSPSKVSPSYTTTEDSKVYRHVSPKVTTVKTKQEHVVNPALSQKSVTSPTWKNSHAPKFFSSHPTPTVIKSQESNGQDLSQESPRVIKIMRQESTSSQNSQEGTEVRYEGGHIPSRVFRHLQTEYPDSSADNHMVKPQENSNIQPPHIEVKAIPSRVVKSHQTSGLESDKSSSFGELDYHCNGMSSTAAHKDTVLKELTSQFGSMGVRKKPRAAPGRVFRHLQDQYDTPEDDHQQEVPQQQTEDAPSFGYRGSKLPSPSFKFLQNQYHQQDRPEETFCEGEQTHNAPEYEEEPLPYQGARLPGRTFKSLQDNMGAHPSVFKPRK